MKIDKKMLLGGAVPTLYHLFKDASLNPEKAIQDKEEKRRREQAAAGVPPVGAPGMKKGGKVGSASKRADGCCVRGKTRGRMM